MVRAGSGDSLPARPDGLVERGGVAIALEQGDQYGDKEGYSGDRDVM